MPDDFVSLHRIGPPAWADRFRSDDLDEIRQFVTRTAGEHSRVVHRPGPVGWDFARLTGRSVSAGWGRVAVEKTIRGASRDPLLHLAIPAGNVYLFGRRRIQPGHGAAMFMAPQWEFTRHGVPGGYIALNLDQDALTRELVACEPEFGTPVFRTHEVTLVRADTDALGAALNAMATVQSPGSPRPNAHADARALEAVARALRRTTPRIRQRTTAPMRLRLLEEWIEAHLEEPITIGRLCEVAAIGERGLQKAFELRRGMSPLRYLAERRLAAARRRLEQQDDGADVTRVALGLGFFNLGRFASEYRALFGETPSLTRRRARH